MSLKSILHGIGNFFSRMFKKLAPIAKKAVDIGVRVTDEIKKFDTEHPDVINTITKLIPGDIDDNIAGKIREKLPEVMLELKLVDATLGLTDPQEIVAAGIKVIQQMAGDYRSATLNSLSIILTRIAADGKIDWADAVYLGKWYYDHKDNDKVDTTVDEPADKLS